MEIVIKEIKTNKKKYIDLLLLADEQESMVDRYLDNGTMYVLFDDGVKAECVVLDVGNGVLEIKNLATDPKFQKRGYAKKLIEFVEQKYKDKFKTLRVGTGDSPLTLPFYKKCGFAVTGKIKNFFVDNYDKIIIEDSHRLVDMIVLEKNL